jgi:hypothetical protein
LDGRWRLAAEQAALFGRRTEGSGDRHAIDTYLLRREDAVPEAGPWDRGSLEGYTLGMRAEGSAGRWGYAFEGAYQFGGFGPDEVEAHALHARLTRSLGGGWRPVLLLEANRASGDSDPGDGRWGRFDALFPDSTLHYGRAGFFSWTNLEHLRLGLSLRPTETTALSLDIHRFALATPADGWFDAEGDLVAAGIPGAPPEVGWEADLTWACDWGPGLSLLAGLAWFEPSGFAEAAGEGDSRQRLYLQTRLRY